MRISSEEQAVIVEEVGKRDPKATTYLFGSRVDDSARGGDIDLLVESETISFSDKLSILAAIKARIGDQKIDLVISRDVRQDPDPLISLVRERAIPLS